MKTLFYLVILLCICAEILECSQASVVKKSQELQDIEKIEKYEDDKNIYYSLLSPIAQELFVYKFCKETRKATSFMINPNLFIGERRIVLRKFKDNDFVSLCTTYEQREKTMGASLAE